MIPRVVELGGIYCARVAGVQIVAEIPPHHADDFWHGDEARASAMAAIAQTGARAIIASRVPKQAKVEGWVPLGRTGHYAYRLGPG